jgi:putative DNA primase/helicase
MQAQQVKWLKEVEAAAARLAGADATKQQETCDWIDRKFGAEAAATAARMFAEARFDAGRETEEVRGVEVSFADEQARADDEPPLLSKASPFDSAKELVRRYCIKEGGCGTRYWQGGFWEWNGRCYEKTSAEKINGEIWKFLDGARTGTKADSSRFRPKPADVEGVMKALKGGLFLNADPPCWLDGRPGASNILVFKNGLVDIRTGELLPLTPKLWAQNALDFEYDPEAKCPVWDRFLSEVFENDPASRDCIEEQLGLGMTEDVRFQKGFLWIGVQGREGKGTLAFVLEKLCGSTAYVSLSFHTWLKGEYSAQAMIGKKVGVFPDVRFKEGKWYGQTFDPGGIDHVSKEMLLKITGGDNLTIGRKYDPVPWQGGLPMKVFLISNDIPTLNDPILVSRFIKIAFSVSFRDREDLEMRSKLEAELPGIANRCLSAYRRLCQRGSFIQPKSGLKLARDVAGKSNPYQAFIQDQCVFDPGGSVRPTFLLWKFQDWCHENGRIDLLRRVTTPSLLSRALKKEVPEFRRLDTFRPYEEQRQYLGIRLKMRAELEQEDDVDLPKTDNAKTGKNVGRPSWRRI